MLPDKNFLLETIVKHLLLAAAITVVLSTNAVHATEPVAAHHGLLDLAQLQVLLGLENPHPTAGSNPDQSIVWFTDSALADADRRATAVDAYRRGHPVAVLRQDQDAAVDTVLHGIFGLSSSAALTIYVRDPDGSPHLHTVAELPESIGDRQQLARTLIESIDTASKALRGPGPSREAPSTDGAELVALPVMVFTETQYASSGNGAFVTVRGEIVRDSGRAHDALVVSAKSTHNLKPHDNGKSGPSIVVPGKYEYFLRLFTPDNTGTLPKLSESRPASSPSTDLNISESHTTTTSYGFGLSREVSAGLNKEGPSVGAKAAFSFDFSRSYSTTNALSFTVKDYSIGANAVQTPAQTSRVYWQMPLASVIASKADYFGRSPSESKMTASMRQVTAEGSAVWLIPGTYAGTMSLSAGGKIDNLGFDGSAIDHKPDPYLQPTASVSIRADSPYLTREVTVFIQSKAGNGGCLRDEHGVVVLRQCPDVAQGNWIEDLHAQWQLDTQGRYFNRGSKKCMRILTSGSAPGGGGEIVMQDCLLNRDQQWEWQTDRIYTQHGEGESEWRMFVGPGNIVGVRTTGKPEYQPIPFNSYHALLKPWSSYPKKPGSTDFIPKLGDIGPNQPISDETKRLGPPLAQERWELIVLRQSLHR